MSAVKHLRVQKALKCVVMQKSIIGIDELKHSSGIKCKTQYFIH